MTDMDGIKLLAYHHIPFETQTEDIEWLFSNDLDVMAANKLVSG
jgi:hypothetical protein